MSVKQECDWGAPNQDHNNPQAEELKLHTLSSKQQGLFKCDVCAASHTDLLSLEYHLNFHIGKITNHSKSEFSERSVCCEERCVKIEQNDDIDQDVYSGEQPFMCNVCPARFNQSYTLRTHLEICILRRP